MIKKLSIVSLLIIAGLILVNKPVLADYMYGEGEITRQIIVDKKVKPVSWDKWSDNLSVNNYSFFAKDLIDFKVIVKNSGETDLEEIEVIDRLPGSTNFIFGPGEYQKDDHQIVWKIDRLNPGESEEFNLRAQVVESGNLPQSGTFPIINQVKATAKSGETDEDTAQFYLKGRSEQLPEAGFSLALGTVLALGLTAIGFLGRKFGRGEILS